MKRRKLELLQKLTAALLVAVMLFVSSGPGLLAETWHSDLDFSQMKYVHFDMTKFYEEMDATRTLTKDVNNGDKVLENFSSLLDLYDTLDTQQTLAYIYHTKDMTSKYYSDEFAYAYGALIKANNALIELGQEILNSPCGAAARDAFGENLSDYLVSTGTDTPAQEKLQDEEMNLVLKAGDLRAKGFSVQIGGKTYTEADLYTGELTYTLATQVYQGIYQKKNQALGELYRQLVQVRTKLAKEHGYDNYAQYQYAGGEYSMENMTQIETEVKQYIVPLYQRFTEKYAWSIQKQLEHIDCSPEKTLQMMEEYLPNISPKLMESFHYMLAHHLYDFTVDAKKMNAGYTTLLGSYNAPYMFNPPESGTFYDVMSMVHEFGHYNDYYENPNQGWLIGSNTDVAEIHSQALELLFSDYYSDIYGPVVGQAAVNYTAVQRLGGLLSGCLYDAFEQYVYQNPNLTLAQMNKKFLELSKIYGLEDSFDKEGYSWVDINHLFEVPFYYGSYARSVLPAWELWTKAQTDPKGAAKTYMNLVSYGSSVSYLDVLKESGLHNPFTPGYVKQLAKTLEKYLIDDRSLFHDTKGHWAEAAIDSVVENGLFTGTGQENFNPSGSVTRGMFITVLYRITSDADQRFDGEHFSDVSPSAWYADAVAWASANHIAGGVGSGRFAPDTPITREEMASMLYRFMEAYDVHLKQSSDSGAFQDWDEVDSWAVNAVVKMHQTGVMSGKQDGRFAPKDTATRAEAAVVIQRFLEALE